MDAQGYSSSDVPDQARPPSNGACRSCPPNYQLRPSATISRERLNHKFYCVFNVARCGDHPLDCIHIDLQETLDGLKATVRRDHVHAASFLCKSRPFLKAITRGSYR